MTELTSEQATAATLETHEWVTIPAGPFLMGSDERRADGKPLAASPAHTVEVDAFRIARKPVSVADFARFVAETSYVTTAERSGSSWVWLGGEDITTPDQDHLWFDLKGASWRHPHGPESDIADKDDHPVTHVSHHDCLAYCEWSGTRLPNEAEWEKAARGTDGRLYPWGDEPPTTSSCNHTMHVGDTSPIGKFPDAAGPHGVEDIAGNVWEWMSNGWHRYPFDENKNQRITTKLGEFDLKVVRGGSFYNNCDPRGVLSWVRVYSHPDYSSYDIGFRVCAP
ncbi:formylglycine-generating enzyme family protein [Saccharopolyspora shandongensis]|uniref:formylglycine-generating enzyme family protein n=1 Tax=Saccharopolyspora shandongensis TaxID=418495 RepID=UPI0033E91159